MFKLIPIPNLRVYSFHKNSQFSKAYRLAPLPGKKTGKKSHPVKKQLFICADTFFQPIFEENSKSYDQQFFERIITSPKPTDLQFHQKHLEFQMMPLLYPYLLLNLIQHFKVHNLLTNF